MITIICSLAAFLLIFGPLILFVIMALHAPLGVEIPGVGFVEIKEEKHYEVR